MDRPDVIVIGAAVDGLACATALARAGRKAVLLERKADWSALGLPLESVASPGDALRLGLFDHGVSLTAAAPVVAIGADGPAALFPDPDRCARSLAGFHPRDAAHWRSFVTDAARLRALNASSDPRDKVHRALTDLLGHRISEGIETAEPARMWLASINEYLDSRFESPLLKGLIATLAASRAALPQHAEGSAALLGGPGFPWTGSNPEHVAAGGEPGLIRPLLSAFEAAGGAVRFGAEATEIHLDREAVSGVELSGGETVKVGEVVAALSARRVVQGLLHTRKMALPAFRRQRSSPDRSILLATLRLQALPRIAGVDDRLIAQGAVFVLEPSLARLQKGMLAYLRRTVPDDPVLSVRFQVSRKGGFEAVISAPLVPRDLADGQWTEAKRDALGSAILNRLSRTLPDLDLSGDGLTFLKPALPDGRAGGAAIFATPEPALEPDDLLTDLDGRNTQPLRGLTLCKRDPFTPRMTSGLRAADTVLSVNGGKGRR